MSDPKKAKRFHSYEASALAVGGFLHRPIHENLPAVAPTCLPSVGGFGSARHERFEFHGLVSVDNAYTHVGGSYDPKSGSWTTIASSVVEGLSVGHTLFADRIVSQISVEHPGDGGHPRVSFLGTHFDTLRVGDCDLKPVLNLDLLDDPENPGGFPKQAPIENQSFLKTVSEQSQKFLQNWLGDKPPALPSEKPLPQDGDNTPAAIEARGSILTSLVTNIGGTCGSKRYGHAIHIPHFGYIYLGELTVGRGNFQLTMLRLDLGSPIGGNVAAGQAAVGGTKGGKGGPGGSQTGTG
jgi:hypothetical protein